MVENNPLYAPVSAISPHLKAEGIQCGLRDKVLGLAGDSSQKHWRCILLTTGTGAIETGDEIVALEAPCLAWVPWRPGRSLRIRAGGVGAYFSVSEEVLVDAIGSNPESVDLRLLVERRVVASMADEREMIGDAEHALDLIIRELHRPRSGSWNMVLAQVRSILVLLWRLSGIEEVAILSQGEPSRLLQRFRQLLEINFRERWPVGDYAAALQISHDRLHDICRRELDKTPRQLIQERVIYEAKLRLERSAMTVEQVAGSIGFRDVGHFSRFFKSKVGLPPASYRDSIAASARSGGTAPQSTYADWP